MRLHKIAMSKHKTHMVGTHRLCSLIISNNNALERIYDAQQLIRKMCHLAGLPGCLMLSTVKVD